MDPTAFLALAERCAPGHDPKPLAAYVRQASGYEPLSLRFDGGPGGTMKLMASDRPEAIRLASELVIAGHRVRVGLASLDTRDLDRLGLSLGDAFEPCAHVNAAAQLLAEDPGQLNSSVGPRGEARSVPVSPAPLKPAPSAAAADPRPVQTWNVYGPGRPRSVLVYGGPN